MRHTLARVALATLLTLSTIGLGASAATAADRTGEAPATGTAQTLSPGLTDALRRDLGLTADQAARRLAREDRAARLAPQAERLAGQAFAGSWYDADRESLVVAVTDAARSGALRAAGAETVVVRHSQAELDTAKAAIDTHSRAAAAPAGVSSWRVDPRRNSVVIELAPGAGQDARVAAFVAAAEQAGPVAVEEQTADHTPHTLSAGVVGGDPYYINGNTRCSIGFAVQGGFVSAGHCGGAGSSVVGWDGSAMGSFAGSSFPGNDYSFIRIGNGWWTVPVVLGWGTVSDVLVRGSWQAPVGSSVCRSGSTTHWHCGTVQGLNETVNYSAGAVYQVTRTSVCAEPGDSGGSFITGDQAQGVTSGGWGNCSSGGQTWFQPVNEILSVYGLSLVTA
ncbi:S1 family peptidase [Kitasatospora sp. NPDC057223]|uniref:S1 family peptidase n=1 Tax=Kitasatospora sp. NPDC057223 TaxID=3346055 RepID=UPI003645A67F